MTQEDTLVVGGRQLKTLTAFSKKNNHHSSNISIIISQRPILASECSVFRNYSHEGVASWLIHDNIPSRANIYSPGSLSKTLMSRFTARSPVSFLDSSNRGREERGRTGLSPGQCWAAATGGGAGFHQPATMASNRTSSPFHRLVEGLS